MADFPAMPIWTDAYLADCSHLSDAEHGIYFRLLMLMWRSPLGRIPNDDEWIARKLCRDANAVRTHVRPIITEFCEVGDWISQKRLQRELAWCLQKRSKNAQSAKARWNKDSEPCERTANAVQETQCVGNAPTPITTPPKVIGKGKPLPTVYTPEFEQFWSCCPRRDGSKAKAFEAYQLATEEGIDHGRLVESIKQFSGYVKRTGMGQRYIAHPVTWLNQRRWESDYSGQQPYEDQRGERPSEKQRTMSAYGDIIAKRNADSGMQGQSEPANRPAGAIAPPVKGLW